MPVNARITEDPIHMDIYQDRSIFHDETGETCFLEGNQSKAAKIRYTTITDSLEANFLGNTLQRVKSEGFQDELNTNDKQLIQQLVDGITGNVGRALVAVAVQQMAIKAICPMQSIRLHKASNNRMSFSWQEGISMRTIDATYVSPFLRQYGLLRLNASGAMMTRSLAENYPYSNLYKAKLHGPRNQWLQIVDRLENGKMDPTCALEYILSLLQNKSDIFDDKCAVAIKSLDEARDITLQKVERAVKSFLLDTDYPARAFEISLHSFMQALNDLGYTSQNLVPLSQMRSANKKHGNVGDIEVREGTDIIESWDAKYKKPYLIDELNELEDKLMTAPRVETAGFVTDGQPDLKNDVKDKVEAIEVEFDTEVKIYSLHDWLRYQIDLNNVESETLLAKAWLTALVESLTLHRTDIAPIDEPCEKWVEDLTRVIKRSFK